MTRMFPFITKTVNPLGGNCPHDCSYCWAKTFSERYNMQKYQGGMLLYEKVLNKKFTEKDFVFVQDMSDLFAECVPSRIILKVLDWIREQPKTKFLLLTKNPKRYYRFAYDHEFSNNVMLGATIETNWCCFGEKAEIDYTQFSKAPYPSDRLTSLMAIKGTYNLPVFVSIEPIMDFGNNSWEGTLTTFADELKLLNPWAVAVGYDNYGNSLPEPKLTKTLDLIRQLEENGIKVYKKKIREAVCFSPKVAQEK